jgi:hypothetical protein
VKRHRRPRSGARAPPFLPVRPRPARALVLIILFRGGRPRARALAALLARALLLALELEGGARGRRVEPLALVLLVLLLEGGLLRGARVLLQVLEVDVLLVVRKAFKNVKVLCWLRVERR